MKLKKSIPIIGLAITIILLIYLESPYSLINKEHVRVSSIPNEVLLAEAESAAEDGNDLSEPVVSNDEEAGSQESEEVEAQDFTLEMMLEEKSKVDGYIVETYREYEIYKNENGELIKKVPTSNFDYIRYYNK
ncbi:hypothetical protein [Niallia endozanthoxylica]|uniref:Uncharacterized protein n=1 Tax=Niallia endozanthoxylica TaxID=2036016 RepID=A0A5J5H8V4_9BACI|nr:hypothetical protein [Niallia endozanthoxylica]KAA9017041.1 hypothetical protein F4V44_21475 [Niallia endozanthoxylica]